jgi:uncharacterized protein (TIGR02246 family)
MREFENKQGTDRQSDRKYGKPAKASNTRRITGWGMGVLALAAALCGAGFLNARSDGKNQKVKIKQVPENTTGTASLLSDNQAIDLTVSQMLGAWQAGDAAGLQKFYADDMMAISGAWEPPLVGWANYARAYQAQLSRTSGCRLERSNSYTKVMGDSAVVTYQWQFAGNVDGKLTHALGHTTLVLQKRAGNWLIVLNHTSAIPTDEPTSSAPATQPNGQLNGQPTSSLAPGRN